MPNVQRKMVEILRRLSEHYGELSVELERLLPAEPLSPMEQATEGVYRAEAAAMGGVGFSATVTRVIVGTGDCGHGNSRVESVQHSIVVSGCVVVGDIRAKSLQRVRAGHGDAGRQPEVRDHLRG